MTKRLFVLLVAASFSPVALPAMARADRPAWGDCGDGFQCASVRVPRDYRRPGGRKIAIALLRLPATEPAERIGSLFINPGGPGGSGIDFVREFGKGLFGSLNRRFDLVGWDPRGVGASAGAVDCAVDEERLGTFSQPFVRPTRASKRGLVRRARTYVRRCVARNSRSGLLPHIHTANSARDLNRLRGAVGDRKLTYLGYSHGTQLGATYATFFPSRVRALTLDGAVKVVSRPLRDFRERAASFEDALGRFLAACGGRGDHCGLGATDQPASYEALLRRLARRPLPAGAGAAPVDGDDLLAATYAGMTQRYYWPVLANALVQARTGNGGLLRFAADQFYANEILDPYVAISALDARWPARPGRYLRGARAVHRHFPHFWWQASSAGLPMGLWPVKPQGAYFGRLKNSRKATTALVVGTTHDPSTPYAWARRMTAELGNARLLTMRGDGHTASFNGNGPCIDDAVRAYLEELTLPPRGKTCTQNVPF